MRRKKDKSNGISHLRLQNVANFTLWESSMRVLKR